jgi:catechol 2,3-dioxygenase-like lactoylglutathione lyase family enzyme
MNYMIRIGSVAVLVSDIQKSKKWYVETLGFEILADEGHWVVVGPKGSVCGLHLCQMAPLEPGNSGISLLADDLETTCRDLKNKGIQFARELAPSEWDPKMKYAMLKDPDGNEFWLVARD